MIPNRYLTIGPVAYLPGGTDAGFPMLAYYKVAQSVMSILYPEPTILGDTPAATWGLAWFYGLGAGWSPQFAVRDDVVLNEKIAYHESGHAFEAIFIELFSIKNGCSLEAAEDHIRTDFWGFRGFPDTWQDWFAYAESHSASAGWAFLPGESLAETHSAAVTGTVLSEWTANYGKDLAVVNGIYSPQAGALRARAWFQEKELEVDVALSDAEIERIAQRVADVIRPDITTVLIKLDSGFNTSVPTFIDRQSAGDKKVATAPIDPA